MASALPDGIVIPQRTSSKFSVEEQKSIADLQDQYRTLRHRASEMSDKSAEAASELHKLQVCQLQIREEQTKVALRGLERVRLREEISNDDYIRERREYIDTQTEIIQDIATATKRRDMILGTILDLYNGSDPDPDVTAAYITTLLKNLSPRKVDRENEQKKWREDLIEFYNVAGHLKHGRLWCCITKQWGNSTEMRAAHIVPYCLGYKQAGYLFGESESSNVLWELRNGLMMDKEVEKGFDKGYFVLLPVQRAGEIVEWKVCLLDQEVRDMEFGRGANKRTWGSLDGVELQFRNNNRPGKRYLYFHLIMKILIAVRYCIKGCDEAKTSLLQGKMWATPGPYLRRSMLAKLAEHLGDTKFPDQFLAINTFTDKEGKSGKEEDAIRDNISRGYHEPFLPNFFDNSRKG